MLDLKYPIMQLSSASVRPSVLQTFPTSPMYLTLQVVNSPVGLHKDTKSFPPVVFFNIRISLAPTAASSAGGDDFAAIQSRHTTL